MDILNSVFLAVWLWSNTEKNVQSLLFFDDLWENENSLKYNNQFVFYLITLEQE